MKQHAEALLALEPHEEVEDLGRDGHVERGRRLVRDEQPRSTQQRHRDHRALEHAARQLVRVGAHDPLGVGQADRREDLADAAARPRRPCARAVRGERRRASASRS